MRIQEQRQQRTDRQGYIGKARAQAVIGRRRQQQLLGRHGGKNLAVTTQLMRDDDDRRQHGDIDQQILHHRDQGGAAQARCVGESRQHRKSRQQRHRHIAQQRHRHVPVQPQRCDHHLHAHQLQRDIGHHRDQSGHGDGQRQAAMAKAPAHKIGGGDVAMLVRHAPQSREGDEHHGIHQGGIGHGKEAGRTGAEHEGRHGDERVGGIEIAPQQEPCDQGAEAAPAQAPFMQLRQVAGAPARPEQAQQGHEHEQARENDDGDVHRRRSSCRKTGTMQAEVSRIPKICHQ